MISKTLAIIASLISLVLNLYWVIIYFASRELLHKEPKHFRNRFISIIVPAFNEEDSIRACAESLIKLDYPKELMEIIIVDDASTDNTYKQVADLKKLGYVKVIRRNKNSGKKSGAINTAKKFLSKKSEFIVVLDADSKVGADTLKIILPYFEDDRMGAVSIRYLPWNQKNIISKLQYFEYLFAILWRRILSIFDSMYVTPGVFSVYRRSVLDEVGWFDERLLTEDMEVALRIQKAGYKIGYCFSSTAFTIVPETIKGYIKQRIRWQRGYFQNFILHKDLIFNPKYGSFGAIFVPLNIASVILVLYASSLGIFIFLTKSLSYLSIFYKLYLINFDITTFLRPFETYSLAVIIEMIELRITKFLVSLDLLSFLVVVSLIMSIVMLSFVKKHTKEPLNIKFIYYPLFLVVYLPLNSLLWLYSLGLQLLGAKEKW